jgi:hypothetical protein
MKDLVTAETIETTFQKVLQEVIVAEDKEKVILEAMIQNELLLMKLEK